MTDSERKAANKDAELVVRQLGEAVEASRSMIVRTKALIAKLTQVLMRA